MGYLEWGKQDCEEGLSPQSDNKEYLEGYRKQYAKEQQLSAGVQR